MSQILAEQQPQATGNYIQKIAMVGVAGQLGKYITEALLKTGKHQITAITREGSTNQIPSGVQTAKVNYDDHASLVNALKGHDALLITMAVTAPPETSAKLVKAAIEAEVPWILPNEWGVDHLDASVAKETMLGDMMLPIRQQIEEASNTSYIAFINGFWYEYSLSTSPLAYGFDIKNRKVTFYDDGKTRINTSTFPQVARGVANLLSLKIEPENADDKSPTLSQFRNSQCYVSSFVISQEDMLASVCRVTGTERKDWNIGYQDSKERYAEGLKTLYSGDRSGYMKLLYARLFYQDNSGLFESRHELDNEKLGLPTENMDDFTKIALQWVEEKGQLYVN